MTAMKIRYGDLKYSLLGVFLLEEYAGALGFFLRWVFTEIRPCRDFPIWEKKAFFNAFLDGHFGLILFSKNAFLGKTRPKKMLKYTIKDVFEILESIPVGPSLQNCVLRKLWPNSNSTDFDWLFFPFSSLICKVVSFF